MTSYINALKNARQLKERFSKAAVQGYSLIKDGKRSLPNQEMYHISRNGRVEKKQLMIEYDERGTITHVQLFGNGDDLEDYAGFAYNLKELNDLQRREKMPVFEVSWPFSDEILALRIQRMVIQMINDRKNGGVVERLYRGRVLEEKLDHEYEPA